MYSEYKTKKPQFAVGPICVCKRYNFMRTTNINKKAPDFSRAFSAMPLASFFLAGHASTDIALSSFPPGNWHSRKSDKWERDAHHLSQPEASVSALQALFSRVATGEGFEPPLALLSHQQLQLPASVRSFVSQI